ncbi:hypothetical protein SAMN03159444_00112 [Pseudomonas sp. NFACC02]|uniref:hypothetical protein n=1 Tax=Pseudomonas sp. NFACC02 TaxID=1566250 RepID=UPI0008AE03DE|nr:hypothetical protein [Pseudomonas sp. NFACC02]SEP57987.1 hypothetical protein SAMN03159444_00112 [Pseudomonas sp. NFACC02]
MNIEKMRAAWSAVKKNAKRELGILLVMVIFGLVAAVIAVTIILGSAFLPDWAVCSLVAAGVIWMVFGETIAAGVRAYRGVKP